MNMPSQELYNQTSMPALIVGTFGHNDHGLLSRIIRNSIALGYRGFDTAPSYRNQEALGCVLNECLDSFSLAREEVFVSDKIDAWQMQESNGHIEKHVDRALGKSGLHYLDLLLIHWPFPAYVVKTWRSFVKVLSKGKVRAIGVCNVRERHLLELIEQTGVIPHVVQVERHPLNTFSEMIRLNRRLNIITQAYSPVARMLPALANSGTLLGIARRYQKTQGQIVMRWHIDTGTVPVFMTKKVERLREYSQIFDFHLEGEDIDAISSLNINHKIWLESKGCPGF
jgi:diketogulonate reductase-like aldo/keto reductase